MKLGVLFSGGKDSVFAMYKAQQKGHSVECLISIISENKESYMFHTPNIHLVELQAKALEIPLVQQMTKGEKEVEVEDLRIAIAKAKKQFNIEGVVTGAIESVYQATRVQKICDELDLWCFNPLWQADQIEFLRELIDAGFKVIITQIGAEGFDKSWLGKELTISTINKLKELNKKFGINPAFEGGEAETLVLNGPTFKREIAILKAEKVMDGEFIGVYNVLETKLG
jgi:ABC transporter with metal-binding/Fe-S-binding domain ATP-binding protein